MMTNKWHTTCRKPAFVMHMKKPVSLLFFVLFYSILFSQEVQWASELVRFSTEYSRTMYSAKQVLGAPDKLPATGESAVAWAPSTPENPAGEFIHVRFAQPMAIRQVAIGESNISGAVSKVTLIDDNKKKHVVYEDPDIKPSFGYEGGLTHITFPLTDYRVAEVKVELNTKAVAGMNQIDCIGISAAEEPVQVKVFEMETTEEIGPPENLGPQVNSFADDMLPIVSPDGKTLYFARKRHPENVGDEKRDDIWYSKLQADGSWGPAIHMEDPLNNEHHNYVAWVSPDGNSLALANDYKNPTIGQRVSMSVNRNGQWAFPSTLPVNDMYNKNEFSCYHMNTEGNVLLLAIERGDTEGDMDIYVSFKRSNNAWTRPMNIGPVVNTAATEGSVFLAADNRTIYFASNGHSGYGGFDMFVSKRLDDTWTNWTEPINMGSRINTKGDEFYYTVPATGDYLYFSSSSNSYGRADLFRMKLPKELQPDPIAMLKAKLIDRETGEPVIADIEFGGLISEEPRAITTSTNGDVQLIVPRNDYEITIKKQGYIPISTTMDVEETTPDLDFDATDPIQTMEHELRFEVVPELKKQQYNTEEIIEELKRSMEDITQISEEDKDSIITNITRDLDKEDPVYREVEDSIYMVPIREGQVLTLNNVFFDANKSKIKEESFSELNEIAVFLKENPNIWVEIGGHTNGLPEDDFCNKLSNDRAESVRQYLIGQGADADRITWKGYGKTQPIADNSTLAGRTKNQRVELKIIKVEGR